MVFHHRYTTDSWPLGAPPTLEYPPPEWMQALVISRDQYGPPADYLRLNEVPAPRLFKEDANRVLVSILATGPNFNTNFAALGLPVPVFGRGDSSVLHIPGSDALGIVVDAGAAVSRIKIGQAVILDSWTGRNIRGYETHDGFNAQFAVVDEAHAIPITGALRQDSPERLAAMLLTFGTAYRTIVERLEVGPGDSVLVMGGGKGTSFAAAQIAKLIGARVILMGSNPGIAESMIRRGMVDAFVDRRKIPQDVYGAISIGEDHQDWLVRTEAFRAAIFRANGGRPVDKIFEHTGGDNFPLLVSALHNNGTLAFFGATGKGLKGEYKETFFYDGNRFVFDARWVWMRQKQILFRNNEPNDIFSEIGLIPGRRGLVWGADAYAKKFVSAALSRGAEIVVIASRSREERGLAELVKMGIPADHVIDRDAFDFPTDMPDPLTSEGSMNPEYVSGFLKSAQALGKALWRILGQKQSPDFIVERPDQSMLHLSTFVLRDFDERDIMPCGYIVAAGKSDLSIRGSHMYNFAQATEVVRLLSQGKIVMEQDDLEVTSLAGLPHIQQQMLDGKMKKSKGVALVQSDRTGRTIAEYEEIFLGEPARKAAPEKNQFLDIRLIGDVAVLTFTRPSALNALNNELLSQFGGVISEIKNSRTVDGKPLNSLILTGAGRAFVAGADVGEFVGKNAEEIASLAAKNIAVFSDLESLEIPVIAVIDGFALGGGNELAMSTHYRIVTENASLGQPEVKLGIIPGYGGMQRLPRLVGPAKASEICVNGESIDGRTAVRLGLADEFSSSATALSRAVLLAREFVSKTRPCSRRSWDEMAEKQAQEFSFVFATGNIVDILSAPTPDNATSSQIHAARKAAARDALIAMQFGYTHGFAEGLKNDARIFGAVTSSPGGQEWIKRFLAKDPLQASFLQQLVLPKPDVTVG